MEFKLMDVITPLMYETRQLVTPMTHTGVIPLVLAITAILLPLLLYYGSLSYHFL